MKNNLLRELLNEGKPTIGTHVIIPWPRLIEYIGNTGTLNYVEFVGEYSTFTLEHLENMGRAIDLYPNMSSMMKVEEQGRGHIATRALDAGIQNLLFTDCRNAEEVRECVRLVRPETPEAGGIHGTGVRRVQIGSNPKEWSKLMNEAVIAIMIEKKAAMDNLEDILAVKGVDMVQFGPGDYSVSLGRPGEARSPDIQKVQRDMIEMALKKGVHPRVELPSIEAAKPFWEMGVRHFCIGWDIQIIGQWCQQQAEAWKKLIA